MLSFVGIIKVISIIQVLLIIIVVLLSCGIKIYAYYKTKRINACSKKISTILTRWMDSPDTFNVKAYPLLKRHPEILMERIQYFDASMTTQAWLTVRNELINLFILPQARRYATSSSWYLRYKACQFFQLSLQKEDVPYIVSLMKDDIPLISITASTLAISLHNQHENIINEVIDIFSDSRRIQQTFYTQIMSRADGTIIKSIKQRIEKEKNPYVKTFCYRTLQQLPPSQETVKTIQTDLHAKNLDLRIAAMVYLTHINAKAGTNVCIDFLKDKHWEVRAKAAKLLGQLGITSSAALLEQCLNDPEWWVRINAAKALFSLGKPGLTILRKQTLEHGKDAFEVAKQVLSIR